MKAIILAAGYGRRMRPLTDKEHKTLLSVGGCTIISRIIDGLIHNGITDIIVATGYLATRLENYLQQTYPAINFTFVENTSYDTTNNIHSLAGVFNAVEIDDDVILIESDLIYEPIVIQRIIESPWENVALVDKYRSGMDGTVVTISDQVITSIIPPHLQDSSFDFSDKYKTLNIYKFSQEFCNQTFKSLLDFYTKVFDKNSYYELLLGILIYLQKTTIHAAIIEGEKWAEVDDPNDLEIANFIFSEPSNRLQALNSASGGYWNYDILDFSYIRNAHFPTPAMFSEMKSNLDNLLCNYGSTQKILNQKLAYFLLCNPENVQLLNGCSQVYPLLRTFFEGRRVLIPAPTFGEYERMFPEAKTYSDRIGFKPHEIESKLEAADVVVFVNPNNPSGSYLDTDWILSLARKYPQKSFIIDESFIDFAPITSAVKVLESEALSNIIVLKSLSKSLGVPGLRLGYVYSCNAIFNDFIAGNIPIWNANSVAENFLEINLKNREALAESYRKTIEDRERFASQLAALPIVSEVFDSAANFLLIRLEGDFNQLQKLPEILLANANIYVKDVSKKLEDGHYYLRVAVRLPEENNQFVAALCSDF